jgi:hypothetical protein
MLLTSVIFRWLACAGVVCAALGSALAQSARAIDVPKLTESFSFTLNQHRDDTIHRTIEAIRTQDEMQGMLDLKAANTSIFTRAIDLFRFVPLKLGSSDINADGFFTPNYLHADYNRPISDAHLFDKP